MTKYEWETELKKNIHSLPADEVKRVLEYYGELFDEMAERGKSEREIINDFGNPFDVANKILSEYDGEQEEKSVVPPLPRSEAEHDAEAQRTEISPQREAAEPQSETPTDENAAKTVTAQSVEVERRADSARIVLFILFNIFTGGVIFIMIGVVWIMLAALVLSGAALVFGGLVAVLSSFAVMSTGHAGVGAAQLGLSVAAVGLGILMTVGCIMLMMLYWKLNKIIFGGIKKLLTVKAV